MCIILESEQHMWEGILSASTEKKKKKKTGRKGKAERRGRGREEDKSINSLMSQQSGINQFHVEQFLPIR